MHIDAISCPSVAGAGRIVDVALSLRECYSTVVIVSFGATDLLLRAMHNYAGCPTDLHIVFISSVDTSSICNFLRIAMTENTCVLIASVSGNTAESLLYARMMIERDAASRLVVVTDLRDGLLCNMVRNLHGVVLVDIDNCSRLSILNGASCLVGSMLGLDVVGLVDGVRYYINNLWRADCQEVSVRRLMCSDHYIIVPGGLYEMGRWFCHVWGEYVAESDLSLASYSDIMHGKIESLKGSSCRFFMIADECVARGARLPITCGAKVVACNMQQMSVVSGMLGSCPVVCFSSEHVSFMASAIGFFMAHLSAANGLVDGDKKARLNLDTAICKARMLEVPLA